MLGGCSVARLAPLLLTGVLLGCTESESPEPDPGSSEPADVVIAMTDEMTFEPRTVRVKPGTTVEWVNRGNLPHTATIRAGNEPVEQRPDGAETWDSGLLESDERFRVTLTTPGAYRYVCTLHLASDMTGRIEVIGDEAAE